MNAVAISISIEQQILDEKRLFRLLAQSAHPDKGGDRWEWSVLLDAHQQKMSELNGELCRSRQR